MEKANIIKILSCLLFLRLLAIQLPSRQSKINQIHSLYIEAKRSFIANPDRAIDSIKLAYQYAKNENLTNEEIKCLNLISTFYWEIQKDKEAFFFIQQSLSLAQKSNIDSLLGDAWVINGLINYHLSNYSNAISNYSEAIINYKKGRFKKKLAITYLNLGIAEKQDARFEVANLHFFKALDIFIEMKDLGNLSHTYNSIALNFTELKNNKIAILYNKYALKIREQLNNKQLIAESYNNLGFAFKEENQPDSAIIYLLKSIRLYQKEQDSSLLIWPLQNLGSAYKVKNKLVLAGRYIKRSLKIANNYSMKEELARGNLDLCEILMEEKRYAQALTAVNVTEAVATELKLPELLMQADDDKYQLYRQMGKYKNALYYETQKETLKDSIFSVAKDKAINELEIKYQVSEKEKKLTVLNLQNKLQSKTVAQQKFSIMVLIIGAVLLSLLFGIAYNSYLQKNKANIRIQHLMQELHHRVKNNLQIMSSLLTIQIENLSDEATKAALRENEARMASMNLIHSQLYQNNSGTQINMESYLSKLLYHIKSSFGGDKEKNISLRLEVDPVMIEADKAVAIGLIVNELATNAFKYAFEGKTGEIYLGLKQEGKNKILLSLGDNGKGIKKENQAKEISFGLKLVNLMARQLNSKIITNNNKGAFYLMEISL